MAKGNQQKPKFDIDDILAQAEETKVKLGTLAEHIKKKIEKLDHDYPKAQKVVVDFINDVRKAVAFPESATKENEFNRNLAWDCTCGSNRIYKSKSNSKRWFEFELKKRLTKLVKLLRRKAKLSLQLSAIEKSKGETSTKEIIELEIECLSYEVLICYMEGTGGDIPNSSKLSEKLIEFIKAIKNITDPEAYVNDSILEVSKQVATNFYNKISCLPKQKAAQQVINDYIENALRCYEICSFICGRYNYESNELEKIQQNIDTRKTELKKLYPDENTHIDSLKEEAVSAYIKEKQENVSTKLKEIQKINVVYKEQDQLKLIGEIKHEDEKQNKKQEEFHAKLEEKLNEYNQCETVNNEIAKGYNLLAEVNKNLLADFIETFNKDRESYKKLQQAKFGRWAVDGLKIKNSKDIFALVDHVKRLKQFLENLALDGGDLVDENNKKRRRLVGSSCAFGISAPFGFASLVGIVEWLANWSIDIVGFLDNVPIWAQSVLLGISLVAGAFSIVTKVSYNKFRKNYEKKENQPTNQSGNEYDKLFHEALNTPTDIYFRYAIIDEHGESVAFCPELMQSQDDTYQGGEGKFELFLERTYVSGQPQNNVCLVVNDWNDACLYNPDHNGMYEFAMESETDFVDAKKNAGIAENSLANYSSFTITPLGDNGEQIIEDGFPQKVSMQDYAKNGGKYYLWEGPTLTPDTTDEIGPKYAAYEIKFSEQSEQGEQNVKTFICAFKYAAKEHIYYKLKYVLGKVTVTFDKLPRNIKGKICLSTITGEKREYGHKELQASQKRYKFGKRSRKQSDSAISSEYNYVSFCDGYDCSDHFVFLKVPETTYRHETKDNRSLVGRCPYCGEEISNHKYQDEDKRKKYRCDTITKLRNHNESPREALFEPTTNISVLRVAVVGGSGIGKSMMLSALSSLSRTNNKNLFARNLIKGDSTETKKMLCAITNSEPTDIQAGNILDQVLGFNIAIIQDYIEPTVHSHHIKEVYAPLVDGTPGFAKIIRDQLMGAPFVHAIDYNKKRIGYVSFVDLPGEDVSKWDSLANEYRALYQNVDVFVLLWDTSDYKTVKNNIEQIEQHGRGQPIAVVVGKFDIYEDQCVCGSFVRSTPPKFAQTDLMKDWQETFKYIDCCSNEIENWLSKINGIDENTRNEWREKSITHFTVSSIGNRNAVKVGENRNELRFSDKSRGLEFLYAWLLEQAGLIKEG